MSTPFSAFHWPDRVIGKRESRRIRDEHNALFNSHAELLAACRRIMDCAERGLTDAMSARDFADLVEDALAKATEGTP